MMNILFVGRQKVLRLEDGHQDIFTCCLTADAGDPFLVGTNFEGNLHTIHVAVLLLLLLLSVYPITVTGWWWCRQESQTPTETSIPTCGAHRAQSYKLRRQQSLGLEQVPETDTVCQQPAGSCCGNCRTVQTMYVTLTAIISIISQPPPLPPPACLPTDQTFFTHLTIPGKLAELTQDSTQAGIYQAHSGYLFLNEKLNHYKFCRYFQLYWT